MAQQFTLSGAHIKLYVNNKLYNTVQSITFTIDYGEKPIYGIDASYPQEIAPSRVSVRGSVSGVRVKYSGGLQSISGRPLFQDIAASPYVSLRIHDRSTGEDIMFIQNAKISRETHSAVIKQTYKISFDFEGQIPLMALDRA